MSPSAEFLPRRAAAPLAAIDLGDQFELRFLPTSKTNRPKQGTADPEHDAHGRNEYTRLVRARGAKDSK